MKKVALLTVLLVVAASAAITITFPGGEPTTVGIPVRVVITSDAVDNVDLFVNPGQKTWAYPTEVDLTQTGPTTFEYDDDIEITHPGTNITLYASKGAEHGESSPFTVVEGAAAKWQIIAPGETADPGNATNPEGKTGTASVTAGEDGNYNIQVCDKWSNIVSSTLTPVVSCTDSFADLGTPAIGLNMFKLREAKNQQTITVTGGGLAQDFAKVKVNPCEATQLLLLCPGENSLPGDNATSGYPGKYGEPVDAFLGSLYLVEIRAVDDCWNQADYDDPDVNVFAGTENLTAAQQYGIDNGTTGKIVDVVFKEVNRQGEWIDAIGLLGLRTDYSTKVVVQPGIDSLLTYFVPPTVPVGVHADLYAKAYVAGDPLEFGYAYPTLIEGPAEHFHLSDTVIKIDEGVGSIEAWADTVGTYVVEVTAGAQVKTAVLTVEERPGVTVIPNPFKYSAHGDIPIKFSYKVAEQNAAEVLLLIADPYGNIVYKATYEKGAPEADAGTQEIFWDRTNSKGNRIASGMYQAVVKITLTNLSTETLKKNFIVIW
ncbi:hypothetical protein CEE36_03805 [candidate division TA06 bacterium B3_TA06]|uniref:FlgD/Vpr Ig-like domain-containing protein n=1 Tax=candidate division TA06 bacterium B3_TA06 TaxID=2012487 RepID=A0A532V8C9_UNCT6|nr:MAG: hypothetical protein CEE36_03805 [candidate division TA06 bacterium B3_TA06]